MRTKPIVVGPPCIDDLGRFRQVREHMLIETLVSQFAIEAFHESVLHRLAWLNVVPRESIGYPFKNSSIGQLSSIG